MASGRRYRQLRVVLSAILLWILTLAPLSSSAATTVPRATGERPAAATRVLIVHDADAVPVRLARSARRIVTLAPHLSEAVFTLGAGERLVAVSDHSDFPPAARRLPRVGDAFSVQLEAVLALRPDLVLVWGASGHPLSRSALARAGAALFVSRPVRLRDVATEMRALGVLLGRDSQARAFADAYAERLERAAMQGGARGRRVFLQMGAPSLYTVGDAHYIGEALRLCGAVNVFAELRGAAPLVSAEAVLARRPDVVLMLDDLPAAASGHWRRRGVQDVRAVPSTLLGRPGPRLADGVLAMCVALGR